MREEGPSEPTSSESHDKCDLADVERLKAGQETALNEIMARHGERLFHYLLRSLQNEEDASDIAQETFVRVFQNRNRFDTTQRFSTWLYAIASNLVKDRFRWRSRHPQVSIDVEGSEGESSLKNYLPDEKPAPSESAEIEERAEAVRRAVGKLPEELRTPFILAEYEGKSHGEIAEILSISGKAVETRIYRARQRLRQELSSLIEN